MKWTATLLIALVVIVMVIAAFMGRTHAYGTYELQVDFDPEIAQGVTDVSYLGVPYAELATAILDDLDGAQAEMVHQAFSDSLRIRNGFCVCTNGIGVLQFTYEDTQRDHELIVVLRRADGSQSVYRAAIPHRTVSRQIHLSKSNAV